MKKFYFMMLSLSILYASGYTKNYEGEYVRWGDTLDVIDTDKLKENNIRFKVEDNKVFIPENAYDDAIMCCS